MHAHVFICPASLCLLVGGNLFTFKVVIDMYDPITIFLTCLGFIFCRSFPFHVFPA